MPGFMVTGDSNQGPFAPPSRKDPIRSYRWILQEMSFGGESWGTGSNEPLKHYAEFQIPELSLEELRVDGASVDYKFAKKANFADSEVVFYAYPGLQKILEEWVGKVYNLSSGLVTKGSSGGYKGHVVFNEVDNKGNELNKYGLYNAWPKALRYSRMSMSDDTLKRATVVFAYDWYKFEQLQKPK